MSSEQGRWRYAPLAGASAGLVVSLVDIGAASALGVSFSSAGHDVTLWVWLYLALSFGVLGWFIGDLARRRHLARLAGEALVAEQRVVAELSERLAIKEKLASLGQLAASIAHEVRNPLAIVRSAVQNLAEDAEERAEQRGEPRPEGYGMVIEEVDRLSGVVSSLLDLARPPQIERQVTEVATLLERALMLTRPMAQRRGVALARQPNEAADRCGVDVDADLLTQVLIGLIDNALQVSPAGAQVTLGARAVDDERVELWVRDAGPGVDEALRHKIFEPLYTTRAAHGGHGLGLAVAQQIVEVHGGRLEVRDAQPRGACFVATLTRAEARRARAA